jgi:RimJ/RimL family protein N-acetyltransferase
LPEEDERVDSEEVTVSEPCLRLQGGGIELRPITANDLAFLHQIATSPKNAFRWRFRGQLPSIEEFAAQIGHAVLAQFLVLDSQSRRSVGHVVAYNADVRSRHCYIGVLMSESDTGTHTGREALGLFIEYLFGTFPFIKLYAEVPEFTVTGVKDGVAPSAEIHSLFKREGELPDHIYADGRHWPMQIWALYLEDWRGRESFRQAWK